MNYSATLSLTKALVDAVRKPEYDKQEELLRTLLEKTTAQEVSVNAPDILLGRPALHHAASKGHAEAMRVLLQFKADVQSQDKYGQSALHHAVLFDCSKLPPPCHPFELTQSIEYWLAEHDCGDESEIVAKLHSKGFKTQLSLLKAFGTGTLEKLLTTLVVSPFFKAKLVSALQLSLREIESHYVVADANTTTMKRYRNEDTGQNIKFNVHDDSFRGEKISLKWWQNLKSSISIHTALLDSNSAMSTGGVIIGHMTEGSRFTFLTRATIIRGPVQMLLRAGADPNISDRNGVTVMDICKKAGRGLLENALLAVANRIKRSGVIVKPLIVPPNVVTTKVDKTSQNVHDFSSHNTNIDSENKSERNVSSTKLSPGLYAKQMLMEAMTVHRAGDVTEYPNSNTASTSDELHGHGATDKSDTTSQAEVLRNRITARRRAKSLKSRQVQPFRIPTVTVTTTKATTKLTFEDKRRMFQEKRQQQKQAREDIISNTNHSQRSLHAQSKDPINKISSFTLDEKRRIFLEKRRKFQQKHHRPQTSIPVVSMSHLSNNKTLTLEQKRQRFQTKRALTAKRAAWQARRMAWKDTKSQSTRIANVTDAQVKNQSHTDPNSTQSTKAQVETQSTNQTSLMSDVSSFLRKGGAFLLRHQDKLVAAKKGQLQENE